MCRSAPGDARVLEYVLASQAEFGILTFPRNPALAGSMGTTPVLPAQQQQPYSVETEAGPAGHKLKSTS
jgi:hypothetical protein